MSAAVIERPALADDAGTVEAFLSYVHEHAASARLPGRVVVSAKQPPGIKPRYKSRSYRLAELDEAAAACVRISTSELNAYVRVHLLGRDLAHTGERGESVDTAYVTHFAADVDIAGPGHKPAEGQTLPPDQASALALVDATLAPSAVISSGGGLYPVWRLAEPYVCESDDDRRRIKLLGRRFDRALAGHGWHVDPTVSDLARVIRPAGVTNHKPGRDPRPVTVARGYLDGAGDYRLDDLERLLPPLPPPKPVTVKPPRNSSGSTASAPWTVLAERYDDDTLLAADPVDQWERVDDQHDGTGHAVPAWRRVGSSADYSIKAGSGGAFIVWSSTLAARLGIEPGGGVSRWQLLCHFLDLDPSTAARWQR